MRETNFSSASKSIMCSTRLPFKLTILFRSCTLRFAATTWNSFNPIGTAVCNESSRNRQTTCSSHCLTWNWNNLLSSRRGTNGLRWKSSVADKSKITSTCVSNSETTSRIKLTEGRKSKRFSPEDKMMRLSSIQAILGSKETALSG